MQNFSHILCAVDLSQHSTLVAEYAVSLARPLTRISRLSKRLRP